MRVLITNIEMQSRSGTPLYVRDLAMELARQGHSPAVYTLQKGAVGDELSRAGILVATKPGRTGIEPEVIHGHHRLPTLLALHRWPAVPAIFICHGHRGWMDEAPVHPRIRRYFGVSRVCLERLINEAAPEGRAGLLLNFVDTRRFVPREALPQRPRRALVFSNYANDQTHLPAISEACRQAGLELDVVGKGVGKTIERPEDLLGQYDLVFAKAKAAIEAMAVGAAVVLCDFSGVGPMVTSAELDRLRQMNFGFAALGEPLQAPNVLHQIARYDALDAARVRDLVRASAGVEQAVKRLVGIYEQAVDEQRARPSREPEPGLRGLTGNRMYLKLLALWLSVGPAQRRSFKRLPGARGFLAALERLMLGKR